MKRYLPLFLLAALLLLLGVTARLWLPALLGFVGANSELIQGLEALAQLVLLTNGAVLAALGLRRSRQPAPTTTTTTTVDTGGGAYVGGDVDTGGGSFTGRDSIVTAGGNIVSISVERDLVIETADGLVKGARTGAADPAALRRATEAYLNYLLDRYRYLQLKGMGVHDKIPLQLPLLDLYVPLKARLEMPEGDAWPRHLRLAGRPLEPAEPDVSELALATRLGEPVSVLDLLNQHAGLIILGDPGAGKTTFLKYLALQLALGRGERLGIGERLPLLASLADYASALSNDPNLRLDSFIAAAYKAGGLDLPMAEMVGDALARGRALLLLDGLDEVRQAGLRHQVVEKVLDFCTAQQQRGNKFVLTSRIVGYRAVRPTRQDGLAECTLVDFDDQEIEAFVTRWTAVLEQQAQGNTSISAADARSERRELLETVQRNPAVRRLAANPLLLTMLAMMKRQGVALPERRVQLYHQAVDTLISSWNRARSLSRQAPARELDVIATVNVLAPLALWIHQESPGVGLVSEWALRQQLEAIYRQQGAADAPAAAAQFMQDIPGDTGLLLARGAGQYGFIHLTFEEYLAAVGVAALGQVNTEPVAKFLSQHVGDPVWREVSLLTVGYLGVVQRRPVAAGEVAAALATERPGPPGEAVVLAGEAVLDAWPDGVTVACKETVVKALVETMQDVAVPAPLRLRAGDALGKLGDPREGVGLIEGVTPSLPDIAWATIPDDGPFTMGSDPSDKMAYDDERPAHPLRLPLFYIARYPVTNAQFRPFVEGDGYSNPAYWTAEGWAWRDGAEADLSPIQDHRDEDWKRRYAEWLARRPKERRNQPWYWEDPQSNGANRPVVGISWYEALAYCRWLDARLRTAGGVLRIADGHESTIPPGYQVCLPSEAEWEKAARGGDGRLWPWSGGWQEGRANTKEASLEQTSPVGIFPAGHSPYDLHDMAGNVYEWTRSRWGRRSVYRPDYGYHYDSDDGREQLDGPDLRVLRGGSWYSEHKFARCAYRDWGIPVYFDYGGGFRVVVSLANSGF